MALLSGGWGLRGGLELARVSAGDLEKNAPR